MKRTGILSICAGIAAFMMALTSCGKQSASTSKAISLETDHYTVELTEQYSDTHYTELTFQMKRKDGEKMTGSSASGLVDSELTAPDWHTFAEVASRPASAWDEDGNLTYSYQIYTSPLHEEVSLHFTKIGEDTCDLTCTLTPEKAKVKTAAADSSLEPDIEIQQLLLSEKSMYLSFSGTRQSISLSIEGEDGTVYYTESNLYYNPSGKTENEEQLYAVHCFFQENPIPLEKVSRVLLNDVEIPVQ